MARKSGITLAGIERVSGAFVGQAVSGLESLFSAPAAQPAAAKNDLAALIKGPEPTHNG